MIEMCDETSIKIDEIEKKFEHFYEFKILINL